MIDDCLTPFHGFVFLTRFSLRFFQLTIISQAITVIKCKNWPVYNQVYDSIIALRWQILRWQRSYVAIDGSELFWYYKNGYLILIVV